MSVVPRTRPRPGASSLQSGDGSPWTRVLDEIAERATRARARSDRIPAARSRPALGALHQRRLSLAAGFVMAPLAAGAAGAAGAETEAVTRETCRLLRAGGSSTLILIDAVNPERAATAGRSDDARRLDVAAWSRLRDTARRVAEIASSEYSLRVSFHPHVGTDVEFEDEVERLLQDITAGELGLCPDTGHLTYAGMDPLAMLAPPRDRVGYLHLKDIDEERLARVRAERRSFGAAVAGGIFRPLGDGCVDFAGLRRCSASSATRTGSPSSRTGCPRARRRPARRLGEPRFLARIGIA